MDSLRAYEGGRGVAYLLAIVGAFAPSVLAMYMLTPQEFASRDWMLSLILAGAIGGTVSAAFVSAEILRWVLEQTGKPSRPNRKEKTDAMLSALMLGPVQALAAQGFAFWMCARSVQLTPGLNAYIFWSCLSALAFCVAYVGWAAVKCASRLIAAKFAGAQK